MTRSVTRRDFLASGLVALGAVAAGPSFWRSALASPTVTDGPYGPLLAADANNAMLPKGFTSRVIARGGTRVPGSSYVWHEAPDGGATFEVPGGGWIYVSNAELGDGGGVGAIRFDERGETVDAYRIASGTARNCAGGPTPWNTWLSCEEHDRGRVWECDPFGKRDAQPLDALGVFTHEAAAVDPVNEHIYLTEDAPDGRFYRFVPDRYPDLEAGTLEVAEVSRDGAARWHPIPDPAARDSPTRRQVARSTRFVGGEGTWYDAGVVYFTTKGDNRVWAYDTRIERMSLVYDASAVRGAPLSGVDNITVAAASGDLMVAEDGGDLEIVMITPNGEVARLLRLVGDAHRGSEIAGPAMDPSGTRLYFSSQRGAGRGMTFEVTGPFRTTRIDRPSPTSSPAPTRAAAAQASATPSRTARDLLPLASDDEPTSPWTIGGSIAAASVVAAVAFVTRRRLRKGDGRPTDRSPS